MFRSSTRLRIRNPSIVYCQASGYGLRGPLADLAGCDPLAGAYTGTESAQGGDGPPVYVRNAIIDYTTALLASVGVLLALVARVESGLGQLVDTCLLDAGALLNAAALVRHPDRPPRDDLARSQYRRHALDGLYECADGWIALTVETHAEWTELCNVIDDTSLADDPRFADASARLANDTVLTQILAARFMAATQGEWSGRFAGRGVALAPVRTFAEASLEAPEIAANGWSVIVDDPVLGPLRLPSCWLRFSRSAVGSHGPAPALGADTRVVLEEIGIAASETAKLHADAVVLDGSLCVRAPRRGLQEVR